MAFNKVEICGINTSRLPVLTNEEKDILFRKIKEGDRKARETYIKGNLRLVLSVIKRFSGSSENADDLFQIGCIGLMKAIDNFDTSLGVKFSTYAVPMIIGEIRRYLRDNNSIRVSRSLRDTAYKAIYAREIYVKKNLREPTIMEIAEEIGIDKEDIVYALDAIQSPMSLFEPVYTEGGDTLYVMDQISDKKNREENWVQDLALQDAIARLNPREKHIIELRFFEGRTQMEVAAEIGISQAQVSRLEKNALKTMRNYLAEGEARPGKSRRYVRRSGGRRALLSPADFSPPARLFPSGRPFPKLQTCRLLRTMASFSVYSSFVSFFMLARYCGVIPQISRIC